MQTTPRAFSESPRKESSTILVPAWMSGTESAGKPACTPALPKYGCLFGQQIWSLKEPNNHTPICAMVIWIILSELRRCDMTEIENVEWV